MSILRIQLKWFIILAICGLHYPVMASDSVPTCIPNRLPSPLCFQVPGGTQNEQKEFFERIFHNKFFILNQSASSVVSLNLQTAMVQSMNSDKKAELSIRINGQKGNSIALAPLTNALFELQSAIPDTGNWFVDLRGTMTIPPDKKNTKSQTTPVSFQLSFHCNPPKKAVRGKPFFQVETISTIHAGWNSPKIRIEIRDTSDNGGTLKIPQIVLRKKVGEDAKAQAHYHRIRFETESGDSISNWTFGKGEKKTVIAVVKGLKAPGSYEVEATFSAMGETEIVQTFTLTKRAHLLWAIFLIVIGTLAGYWVLKLVGSVKPRLLLTRHGVILNQKLDLAKQQFEHMNKVESRLHSFLKVEVEEMITLLRFEIPAEIEPQLNLLRAKIEVFLEWVAVGRQVALLDEDQQTAEMKTPILEVEAWIRNSVAKPEEKADQISSIAKVLVLVEEAQKNKQGIKGFSVDTQMASSDLRIKPIPTIQEIESKIRKAEIWSTLVITILAVLIGLVSFYYPNESWGTASDKILLVLWGFGLHTITKNTDFGGGIFSFLTGKLTPSRTTPNQGGEAEG